MKEVDFRGKDINTGDWIYGSYVADYTISDSYSSYIRPNYRQTVEEMYAIDLHTLGQFIGLYDRNADRIFEGDIVRCTSSTENSAIYIIQYEEEQLSYVFKTSITKHAYMYSLFDLQQYELGENITFEILGNIYDNPELIEYNL